MVVLSIKTTLSEERFEKEIKGPLEKSIKHIKLAHRSSEEKADVYLLSQN